MKFKSEIGETFIAQAIFELYKGSNIILHANGNSEFEVDAGDVTTFNITTVLQLAQVKETAWLNDSYKRARKAEYDKLNQFELMHNDLMNGTTTWPNAIYNIKRKFPKPL
jgi:hypothetical protein